jgi:penicillin-binding protein 1A
MMNTMMRETLQIGTAQKAQLAGWPAAGKTGTSQDFRDAWFIGYTGHLVTGVWLGNDDSSPTRRATGGGMPVDIWARFMRSAHQGVTVAALPGQSSAPSLASIVQQALHAPTPANVQPSAPAQPQRTQQPSGSLDGWLIDRLFGRR